MRYTFCIFFICIFKYILPAQVFYQQESNLGVVGHFGADIWFGGGGVSFADFNQDGLDDLTFGTEAGQNIKFYENKGNAFEEVNPSFVTNTYENRQLVWVDYDNDGDKDFFACATDGPNRLYQNDGSMNFTDVTASVGLPIETKFTSGASFADIDEDGFLDLYISQFVLPNGSENEMWKWNPTTNQYQDYTLTSGTANGSRTSYCATFFDFDNDDDLDLYVINDSYSHENSLYMNTGNGVFVDVSVPSLSNLAIEAMNAGIGDFDNDHDFDIYITETENAVLLSNNGNNTFTDLTTTHGAEVTAWSWTGNFFDYDNDRDLDLYISTEEIGSPNPFFVNDGTGNFSQPLLNSGGIANADDIHSYTHAIGDYNNDGRSDIMVQPQGILNFRLYSNQDETENNFIKLHLVGVESSRDAYGAMIEVWAGGTKTILQTYSVTAYHCQNSDYVNIGLGENDVIDSLVINWPYSNNVDVVYNSDILVNGMNVVTENAGVTNNYTMPLCMQNHEVVVSPIPSQTYGASINLASSAKIIPESNVVFQALNEITLDIGFEIKAGAEFLAEINYCGN